MYKYIVIFISLCIATTWSADAQEIARKGVVWQVPGDLGEAKRQLQEIESAGIEAVRTGVVRSSELLTLADTLGIDFYIDLPPARLPAARLRHTVSYASAVLDTVLGLAQVHPSVRNIGLSRYADTSDSTACAYYDEILSEARDRAPAGTRFYYTTRFIERDVCRDTVDFVLLGLLRHERPFSALRRWNASREEAGPVGVGALGTWVRWDTLDGLSVPHSPQQQARYFEEHLPTLLSDTLANGPEAIFVYRWQDRPSKVPLAATDLDEPYVERYGLHTVEGEPRPAVDVVEGIYTGQQTVFAFAQGDGLSRDTPWTTLLGWSVFLMLGVFYATSPRFRQMVPRYFQAHVFFLEAVREGREVLFGASTVLLTTLGISSGILVSVCLNGLRQTDPFALAVSWLPTATQVSIASLLGNPAILAVLAGCIYVLILLVWTFILALFTRRKYLMSPSQVLMLVAWTRWPILFLLVGAMVVAVTPGVDLIAISILLGGWLLVEILAVARTLYDLVGVSRIPAYLAILCLVLHPGILILGAAAISSLAYQPELAYLWHAITRV